MNISKLVSSNLREVLTEANYDVPSEDNQNVNNQQIQNQPEDNPPTPEQTDPVNQMEPTEQEQDNQEQIPEQDDGTGVSADSYDNYDPNEGVEDYDPKDDIPKLKILKSLSDEEYQLCNIRCFNQFKELRKNVDGTINNNIMNVVTKNEKQRQVVSIVHNNLSKMLTDLDNYLIFRFSEVYEDNILAYVTYLKRYRTAMKIIELVINENRDNSRKDK